MHFIFEYQVHFDFPLRWMNSYHSIGSNYNYYMISW